MWFKRALQTRRAITSITTEWHRCIQPSQALPWRPAVFAVGDRNIEGEEDAIPVLITAAVTEDPSMNPSLASATQTVHEGMLA